MGFFKIKNVLTNTKVATQSTPKVVMSSAEGTFRINKGALSLLGVRKGDYVSIDDQGDGRFYIFKADGNGPEVVGVRGQCISATKNGAHTISAKNAWNLMNGEEGFKTTFVIKDAEGYVEQDEAGNKYFLLADGEKKVSMRNAKGEEEEEEEEDAADVSADNDFAANE